MFHMPEPAPAAPALEKFYSFFKVTPAVEAMCKELAADEPEAEEVDLFDDDEDVDLFGDDDDEDEDDEANEKRLAAVAEAHKQKKIAAGKFKKVVGKSQVMLDIKPWSDETDLAAMEKAVRAHVPEGLAWQGSQKEEIGYGVFKLRILCIIFDDLVTVDEDIIDPLVEKCEEYIQSVDIYAFNKV